jgi:hypothetical protein
MDLTCAAPDALGIGREEEADLDAEKGVVVPHPVAAFFAAKGVAVDKLL